MNSYVTVDPAFWVKFTNPDSVHPELYTTVESVESTLTVKLSSGTLEDERYWIWSNQKVCWCKTVTFMLNTWGPFCRLGSLLQKTQLFWLAVPADICRPMLILSIKHSQLGSSVPEAFDVMLAPRTLICDPEKWPKNKDTRVTKRTNHWTYHWRSKKD